MHFVIKEHKIYRIIIPQWGAADAEIKVLSGENTELKRSPFKAWSGSVYCHACYAYCQGFLPCFYPSGKFTCIFSQNLSRFFPALAVANTGSCVGPQNKIGHPVGCRSPCWVPAEYNYAKKTTTHDLWYDDLWNEKLGDRVKCVFSPDVILCGWLGSKHQLTN